MDNLQKTDSNANCNRESSPVERGARPLNCDQVAWMLAAIERHLPNKEYPAVSRAREMQKYALLYELMEVAHLYFADASAQHNGTPPDVRRFQFASKNDETNHTARTLGLETTSKAEEQEIRERVRTEMQIQASNAAGQADAACGVSPGAEGSTT